MTTTNNPIENAADPGEEAAWQPVRLKAPRLIVLDALLFFVTFGFYSIFWLPARVGELKRAERDHFAPWLWCLVPFFWIAQVFALPRFLGAWTSWGREHGLKTPAFPMAAAVLLVVLGNIVFVASSFAEGAGTEFPYTVLLSAWVMIALGYTLLAWVVRRVIRVIPPQQREFKRHFAGFGWMEWLLVVPSAPFAALAVYGIVASIFIGGSELPANHVYENEEAGFTMTLSGEGWQSLPLGSYSQDESVAEFRGALNVHGVIVRVYPPELGDMNSLVQSRLQQWTASGYKCSERRAWTGESGLPVAHVECSNDQSGGYQTVEAMTLIQRESDFLEAIGFLEAVPAVIRGHRADFISSVQSLEVMQ